VNSEIVLFIIVSIERRLQRRVSRPGIRRFDSGPCRRSPPSCGVPSGSEGIPRDRSRDGSIRSSDTSAPPCLPLRVQCQEAKPGAPRRVLNGSHQLRGQARATAPTMYQQLRNLRAMRLVRCPGRVELDGAGRSLRHREPRGRLHRSGMQKWFSATQSPARSSVRGARKLTAAPDSTASTRS